MNEQENKEMSLDEAVATVVGGLPAAVREFVTGPERDRIALELSQKYHLHADQAGGFQHAYLFLLLGITAPDEFMQSLRDENIPEASVAGLANDVNEMVFKPLRAKEQAAVPVPQPLPDAAVPVAMATPTPGPGPTPALVPPMQLVTPPAPVIPPPPPPAPIPQAAPVPSAPVPPSYHSAPHEEGPSVRTMASDMQAVREHRAPEPLPYHPSTPMPAPAAPLYTPPTPVPPPIAPVAAMPPQAPAPAPLPARTPPPPPNLPGAPIVKEYSVDPYREPVE